VLRNEVLGSAGPPHGRVIRNKRTAILIPLFTSVSGFVGRLLGAPSGSGGLPIRQVFNSRALSQSPHQPFPTRPRQVLKPGVEDRHEIVSLEALIIRIPQDWSGADRLETLLGASPRIPA